MVYRTCFSRAQDLRQVRSRCFRFNPEVIALYHRGLNKVAVEHQENETRIKTVTCFESGFQTAFHGIQSGQPIFFRVALDAQAAVDEQLCRLIIEGKGRAILPALVSQEPDYGELHCIGQ